MTAVGLGQQGSQAVGLGFESLSCQIFSRFIPNIFDTRNWWNTTGFLYEIFGTVRPKIFDGKFWYFLPPPSPLSIIFFATGNFLKYSTERFLDEIFRHCETKNFQRKIVILPPSLPPFLSIKFFDYGNFVKPRMVPRRSFPVLWDKNFSTENRDTLLNKVQKSVTVVLFLTVCKSWSKYL